MKIAIIGAGSIGSHLARYLSGEHMDIIIVDKNPEKLFMLNTEHNLMTVEGDGTKLNVLKKAEAGNCDLFLAVTDVAERNMVACSIAKEMGAGITVARVNRLDYLLDNYRHSLHRMGVDHAIFPEQLVAQNIIDSLSHAWASNWLEFNHGQLIMLGVRLADEAPLAGKYLRELNDAHQSMHVAAIRRDYDTLMPRGDRQLLPGDMLYVTTTTSGLPQVAKLTGKQIYTVKHAVMAGCGPIAEMVLDGVPRQLRFSIVENDIDQARQLIRRHPGCELIHGEPSEINVLTEAGIAHAEAFVALTHLSEANVLTCLTARGLGVRKTIAQVERHQFFGMAESFNIGTIVNKQMLVANAVFQLLIDEGSLTTQCMVLPGTEMIRLEIKAGSRVTASPVKDLSIPKEITFAALIRQGKSELVTGQTHLTDGDHVLVVCLPGALQKAKRLFQ